MIEPGQYEQTMNESISELEPKDDLECALMRLAYTLGYRDALQTVTRRHVSNVINMKNRRPQ